jgi:hypothetical protein
MDSGIEVINFPPINDEDGIEGVFMWQGAAYALDYVDMSQQTRRDIMVNNGLENLANLIRSKKKEQFQTHPVIWENNIYHYVPCMYRNELHELAGKLGFNFTTKRKRYTFK